MMRQAFVICGVPAVAPAAPAFLCLVPSPGIPERVRVRVILFFRRHETSEITLTPALSRNAGRWGKAHPALVARTSLSMLGRLGRSSLLTLGRFVYRQPHMSRWAASIAGVLLIALGCAPERKVRDTSLDASAGVNIVPEAILASEKIPPSTKPTDDTRPDLISVLSQSPQHHEQILRALRMTDMVPMLREQGPFTLFAPTDEAFAKLPPGTLDRLLQNPRRLRALLEYHMLPGRITFTQILQTNGQVATLAGPKQKLIIRGIDRKVMVNDANVIRSEQSASNGVIHWIDGALFPQS
jgi:uncharacterized surface protein with fasciclin (FAS1) repeats